MSAFNLSVSSTIRYRHYGNISSTTTVVTSNGTYTGSHGGGVSGFVWTSVSCSGTIISITQTRSSGGVNLAAIEIDGTLLTNNKGTGIDSLVDTPTNYGTDSGLGGEVGGNYCTWNPLHHLHAATLANGNLQTTSSEKAFSTFLLKTGKWYVEHTVTTAAYNLCFSQIDHPSGATPSSSNSKSIGWYTDGTVYWGAGYDSSIATSYGADDVLAAAIDMDNSTIKLYKNGSLLTTIDFTSSNYHRFTDGMYVSQFSGTGHWNFGQRSWAFAPPSGYKALCTTNLPEPTIADGSAYMDVDVYSKQQQQLVAGLKPDLMWLSHGHRQQSFFLMLFVGHKIYFQ